MTVNKLTKIGLALFAALSLVVLLIAPAGAASQESADWLNINTQPNGICGYAHGDIDANPALPGTVKYVSYGTTSYRDTDPCTPGASNVARDAADLGVQVSMNCRYISDDRSTTSGEHNVWTGNVKWNPQNTGAVAGGLDSAHYGTTVPGCVGDFNLNPQLRTIVKSWYWTAFGYVTVTHSTHWVDVP
jgi:hypothetical protein